MHRTTNLAWPVTPFGAGQRPFGKVHPMMATVTVGWAGHALRLVWACVVYLNTDSVRTLCLNGQHLKFGFEVLTADERDQPGELAHRLDDILVVCRRKAKILVGHDLALDLARLGTFTTDRRLPGVEAVDRQWADRSIKGRGMATMFDTAHDLGQSEVTGFAATCEHVDLKVPSLADPKGATTAGTVRQAIIRTLAISLVAARVTGKYHWTAPIDVGQFVTTAAWDHLAELGDHPPDNIVP